MQVYALYYILNNHFTLFLHYTARIFVYLNLLIIKIVYLSIWLMRCINWCVLRDMVVNELLIKIALLIEYQSV